MTGWRSAVVAKLRAITRVVNTDLVAMLRAEARSLESVARLTLPDQPGAFRVRLRAISSRAWDATEQIILDGIQGQFLLADEKVAEFTTQVITARTDLNRRPELLDSEMGQVLERVRKHAAEARHGRTLSDRVWANDTATRRRVQAEVDQAIRDGESPAKLARRVREFVQPGTPGGASYAAMRLARTELLAAWDARERQDFKAAGIYSGAAWMLSPTHRGPDVCDELAQSGPYGLDALPDRPHPHCFCWLDPVVDEDAVARLEEEA